MIGRVSVQPCRERIRMDRPIRRSVNGEVFAVSKRGEGREKAVADHSDGKNDRLPLYSPPGAGRREINLDDDGSVVILVARDRPAHESRRVDAELAQRILGPNGHRNIKFLEPRIHLASNANPWGAVKDGPDFPVEQR